MLLIVSIASLLAAIIGALIALGIQRGLFERMEAQRQAWERTQQGRQNSWEMKQEKDAAELETRLTRLVQQIQKTWEEWEIKDQEHLKAFTVRYENAVAQLEVEHELTRLPRIEDVPLTSDAAHSHQYTLPDWKAPRLQGINLSGRDLSHRYLGYADLRNAQLANANFYMADLSGAFLTGANLAGADLSGANLAGADLRDATLTGANLLVADLYGAILVGAMLRGARNLTAKQVYTAFYDSTTLCDPGIDTSRPSTPDQQPVIPASTSESAATAKPSDDSQPAPAVIDIPGDTPENTRTGEFDPATSRPARNGKKRAKAN